MAQELKKNGKGPRKKKKNYFNYLIEIRKKRNTKLNCYKYLVYDFKIMNSRTIYLFIAVNCEGKVAYIFNRHIYSVHVEVWKKKTQFCSANK